MLDLAQCTFLYATYTCVLCITLYCNYYEEMNLAMKASNQKVKSSTTLKYVFDIKNWIAPHLDEIHGHTLLMCFVFDLPMLKEQKCTNRIGAMEAYYR